MGSGVVCVGNRGRKAFVQTMAARQAAAADRTDGRFDRSDRSRIQTLTKVASQTSAITGKSILVMVFDPAVEKRPSEIFAAGPAPLIDLAFNCDVPAELNRLRDDRGYEVRPSVLARKGNEQKQDKKKLKAFWRLKAESAYKHFKYSAVS